MPLSGTITPAAGPQSTPTPTAAREAFAAMKAAREAAAAEPAQRGPEPARASPGVQPDPAHPAVGMPPAPGVDPAKPEGDPAKPDDEKYEAWRVEALARRERAATQEKLAAKAERDALAREKTAMDAREKTIGEREARADAIEKRMNSYRYNPHFALQDLAQFGVSFEMLAQAVAQGMATPDQLAAAEAAAARQEIESFRADQARRDAEAKERADREQRESETARQRSEREAKEREARARAAAEAEATKEWKDELRAIAARDAANYPITSSRIDRGALDVAYQWAEDFLAKNNRVPTNEEVLDGVETQLQEEAQELAQLVRQPRPGRAATLSNQFRPAPQTVRPARPETDAERKGRVLKMIDAAFGRSR